jgi:hypothetical protein
MLAAMVMVSLFFLGCGGGRSTPSVHNEWTWMNGANVANQPGIYGTLGTAALSNVPGARMLAVSQIDASGNFWLFGGNGFDSTGNGGDLDDLWKYSAGEWTWVNGSNIRNQPPTFGTLGVAASGNVPGARNSAASWIDASGSLWLFGGNVNDIGLINDLWEYSAGEWTWVGGSNVGDQPGTYGSQGTAAPGNVPGARQVAVSWTDASGNFWLFGGSGYDSIGAQGSLNDLWKYSAGEWTWMGGSNVVNNQGTYGTQGTAAASNIPGARNSGVGWIDASGNLWLFGGLGYDSMGTEDNLNDLWKYSVSTGEWTWVGGSNMGGQSGTYGTQGTASPNNVPGARYGAISWIDASGNFWLFCGSSYNPDTGTGGWFNDLWKYSASEWTWMGGSNAVNQPGTYGNEGTAAPSNIPGARYGAAGWADTSGNLWLLGGYDSDLTGEGYFNDLWKYEP